jgi:threonine/homoserine/homoserine lactone efflux protein
LIVYLVLGITYGFAAAVQPGPMQTFLISQALTYGWRHTLLLACAPIISDIPVIVLVLIVLNIIPIWVENVLHLVGGFFLLYLAWGAFKTFSKYTLNQTTLFQSKTQSFFKAVLVNLINPNPFLGWSLVMGPLLLQGWRESVSNGVALVAGFYGIMILTTDSITLVFASIRRVGARLNRILIGISAIALAGFAIYQLWLGATGLWF